MEDGRWRKARHLPSSILHPRLPYNPPRVFDLIQVLYWLALSSWFGGVLLIAIAAPIIMRAMREEKPILPGVLSVNLESQHGTLLGGSIIGRIMDLLFRVELACAAVLFVTIAAQLILLRP